MSLKRIDQLMSDEKLVLTRSQARMLIKQGDVLYNNQLVTKPGMLVEDANLIKIKKDKLYVSRGAYKLLKALDFFQLDVKNKVFIDCGASTGGFTQVLLERGACKVFALDVGHDQLVDLIRNNEKVINMEGVNLKHSFNLNELVDGFVMDLSFISIKSVIENVKTKLKNKAIGIILIKPQFEIGREGVNSKGVVEKNKAIHCAQDVRRWLMDKFEFVSELVESPVRGKAGNIEFLVWVKQPFFQSF